MNNPIKKRVNPFAMPAASAQPKAEPAPAPVEKVENVPKPVEEKVQKPVQKKASKKVQVDDKSREKYTATMLVSLRRKIKVYCATRGIMFSEFIEEACAEKLKREGE